MDMYFFMVYYWLDIFIGPFPIYICEFSFTFAFFHCLFADYEFYFRFHIDPYYSMHKLQSGSLYRMFSMDPTVGLGKTRMILGRDKPIGRKATSFEGLVPTRLES